jgi:GTPase Era involved in 16S rRNA processing
MEMLKIFNCHINLKLFVKLEKDWRDNELFLKQIKFH